MISKKLAAFTLAAGVALSGAYAVTADAAPTPGNVTKSTPRATVTPGTKAAGINDMNSDKRSYTVGENYTVTVDVVANSDMTVTVNYGKVTGATCRGTGSVPVTFSGTNSAVTTKKVSFTCKMNSSPVNGTVSLTVPDGVTNLTDPPNLAYTIGGKLPTTTPTKAPTKSTSGGLAKTGV